MKQQFIAAALAMFAALSAHAAQEKEFTDFFRKYESLGNNYDVSISDLYSDEAVISAVMKRSGGTDHIMNLNGKQWKQAISTSMSAAKIQGDKSEYRNLKVVVEGNRARITASRYASLTCFADDQYYMIAEKQADNKIRILEEFVALPQYSNCAEVSDKELSAILQGAAEAINKKYTLPIMIDADTKLEEVTSTDDTVIFNYELVNITAEEVGENAVEENFVPLLIQQSCGEPDTRSMLDLGAVLSYRYIGKNKQKIAEINISKSDCE